MQWTVGSFLGLYILIIILLSIPFVQHQITRITANTLSNLLGTKVSIGHVDLGFLDRVIIDDVQLSDTTGQSLAKISRLSARLDWASLFNDKVSINHIQLFGFDINLYRSSPTASPNFQFIIDALAPKDSTKQRKSPNIRINSILMRRGRIAYNVWSQPTTSGKFNPSHIEIRNVLANISIKALQSDSINFSIKRMSLDEANSLFRLKRLSLKAVGSSKSMQISNFKIDLPQTLLAADTIYLEYDSLQAFRNLPHQVKYSFSLQSSKVTPADLSPFVPVLRNFTAPLHIEMQAQGTLDQPHFPKLSISSPHQHLLIDGAVSLKNLSTPSETMIYGHLKNFQITPNGMDFVWQNMGDTNIGRIPPTLQRLGTIRYNGEISGHLSNPVIFGRLTTDLGQLQTDVKISANQKRELSCEGKLKTPSFQIGKLFNNKKLGETCFDLHVNSFHAPRRQPMAKLKGVVSSLQYAGYNYQNILIDATTNHGEIKGSLTLNDDNGHLSIKGSFNPANHQPSLNVTARVDRFRPHELKLTSKHQEAVLSFALRAAFTGASINDMVGEINLDSLHYMAPQKQYLLDNFNIKANKLSEEEKSLTIRSPFLNGNIHGDYTYQTLPTSITNILHRYLPALIPAHKDNADTSNNFQFNLQLSNSSLASVIFDIPLTIYTPSSIQGYINDHIHKMRLEAYFPKLYYKNRFVESGVFLCHNTNEAFHTQLRFNSLRSNKSVNLAVESTAIDNRLNTIIHWGNNGVATYSGELAASARFIKQQIEQQESIKTLIDIHPTQIILNDTIWDIHPSTVSVDSGKVHIDNFRFSHLKRHLLIDGTLSKQPTDTVRLNFKDINIGYIFDIVNLGGVSFSGEATGPAYASGVFATPSMSTDLFIRNMGLNEGLLGDAHIHGEWHPDTQGIYLDADIRERETAHTLVTGYIYPIKPKSSLDLDIRANHTNLRFIHRYMSSITPDFQGRATGRVHLYGKFKALTMQGSALGDASMQVGVLNNRFYLKDSVFIEPQGLTFKRNRISDIHGNQGTLTGELRYNHFKDIRYNFNFHVNQMQIMDTQENPDFPFYGKVFGTGNASIQGNVQDGVNINVAMTTNRNTSFTFIKDNVGTAISNQFVKFVDKTPKRQFHSLDEEEHSLHPDDAEEQQTDIRLNLLIDATPEAQMKIIMDPIAGDYISGRGSGNIRTEFYNKGDVKMFGNYRINHGTYKFSLQEVIRKDFTIRDGSSISFNGSPFNANMDIKAIYTVSSASLNDLLPASATTTDYLSKTNVKVNCIMNLSGNLTSPNIKLGIELPNERDEVQALVRNYIPTDEQMNMQILYLLSIGKFYTPENVAVQQNSDMMSSVLSSTLSGQLNNALSNVINNNNWNIGTNLSTGEKGWTDVEFEGMLSGQLLNNRLIINGNFGYRDNPLANTNFVGDFDAEWLINRSGDIRLKAYNETNDRYYTRTNLTTQGIGILFKKDFNKWKELLFWNRWRNQWLQRRREKEQKEERTNKQKAESSSETRPEAKAKQKRDN